MRTGTAHLPLHNGKAPAWLFQRMTLLAREIISLMVMEFGAGEVLARLSDPYWFQSFGCVPAITRDPARFSFAHGGKDGFPYPVNRQNYDRSISVMKTAVEKAKMGEREKVEAVKRLAEYYEL